MKLLKRKLISLLCVLTVISVILCLFAFFDKSEQQNNKYFIECKVEENKLFGKIKLDFFNSTGKRLDELCFCLYPNAFKNEENVLNVAVKERHSEAYPGGFDAGYINIESCTVDGKNADFTLEENEQILVISNIKIGKNAKKIIEISFNEKLPYSPMRFGYGKNTYNFGNWYPILCPIENGEAVKTTYISNGDPFYSEIADYDVSITASSNMRIASTGIIEEKTVASPENYLWKIKAENVRDFAFVMSEKFDLVSQKVGNTVVYSYFYSDLAQGMESLKNAVEAIEFFNKIYGEYPYKTFSVSEADFYIGGMEYPNLVFISDELYNESEALEEVVVHETAHQWWYGIVGNNELKEPWLDEGLTEYSVALFLENKYGKERYDMFIRENEGYCKVVFSVSEKLCGTVDKKIAKPSNEFENWMMYDALTYDGTSVMLDGLRKAVGDDAFFNGVRSYYESEKFKTSTREKFLLAFSNGCGKNISTFVEPWLDGNVYWG